LLEGTITFYSPTSKGSTRLLQRLGGIVNSKRTTAKWSMKSLGRAVAPCNTPGMTLRSVFINAKDQREVAAGQIIFREGDQGEEMFGVVSGKVELRRGDDVVVTVGPDGTFGEIAIVSDAPRSLTAVAVEPSQIAAINRHTFLFLVHETPTFALDVMRTMADRILAHGQ
jgi:CRP/FNR family cyclic AMP-dependent transcriptional regulator